MFYSGDNCLFNSVDIHVPYQLPVHIGPLASARPVIAKLPTSCSVQSSGSPKLGFKLVGDNLDKSVKSRYLRLEGPRNKSLHCFNSFAVQNRIDFSHLPDALPSSGSNRPLQLASALLPSSEDDKALRRNFVVLISRILATHIPFFKFSFDDVVEWHIEHMYYEQMSSKSVVVSSLIICLSVSDSNDFHNATTGATGSPLEERK